MPKKQKTPGKGLFTLLYLIIAPIVYFIFFSFVINVGFGNLENLLNGVNTSSDSESNYEFSITYTIDEEELARDIKNSFENDNRVNTTAFLNDTKISIYNFDELVWEEETAGYNIKKGDEEGVRYYIAHFEIENKKSLLNRSKRLYVFCGNVSCDNPSEFHICVTDTDIYWVSSDIEVTCYQDLIDNNVNILADIVVPEYSEYVRH